MRSKALWGVFAVACSLGLPDASALAQDQGALQAVGLFRQSCIQFVGNAYVLREWIVAHHLPPLAPEQTAVFANGLSAMAFGAGTRFGHMVLVSRESGACSVVVEFGDTAAIEQALTNVLQGNATILEMRDRPSPSVKVAQRLYRVEIGAKRLVLSVLSRAHDEAPTTPPQITLVATLDDGRPLLSQ